MRGLLLVAAVPVLAGCGGGDHGSTSTGPETTPATATPARAAPAPHQEVLYSGPQWAVVMQNGKAEVLHRVGGKQVVDRSGAVKIQILGPRPGSTAPNPPQVAIAMHSKTPLVESALWVDRRRLFEKGGGTPTNGTIYGAPTPLDPGTHTAVGYARSTTGGSAVAWTFRIS
jgi:hypothetical protein